jgi:cysteine desulfurase / selenocysteine lyase
MVSLMEKSPLTQYNVNQLRRDFPILKRQSHGHPLVYLDNAATTQKPEQVIQCMSDFYRTQYGTVRRGVYELSAQATFAFDDVRNRVATFLNAPSFEEIVFTKGTTEAINLVSASYGRPFVQEGDEILVSAIEHHANIVPWQQLCLEKKAKLIVIPVNDDGELILEAYEQLLSDRTRLVAVNHVSNALGTINPIRQMIQMAHTKDIPVLIDGAQSAPHMVVDVQAFDCDFYAFSGHKLYGPTGIGVLYAKKKYLEAMVPYQCGGDMIEWVTFEKTTFAKPPHKFEAGTPPIVEVIGLGSALDYLENIGLAAIEAHEHALLETATERLQEIEGLRIIGTAREKAGIISFVFEDIHPHDVGTLLDQNGIAVRAGHHCTQPVMDRFGVPATTRVSFGLYNTIEEIDALVDALHSVIKVFR